MKGIKSAFVTGFLVLVPVLATVDIVWWFVRKVDASTRAYLPENMIINADYPGVGLLVAVLFVFIAGILTQNYVGKWVVKQFDWFLGKFPFVGGIYAAIKQFLEAIFNPQKDQFKEAVLVPFPREGLYSIGFLTGLPDEKLVGKTREKLLNVFVPCTPNPTSGFYMIVKESEVKQLDMSVQDAFKILISMGIVKTDDEDEPILKEKPKATSKKKKRR